MKKTVVTLLLVLPFILIYFISFTGQILSTYTHIYVERLAIVDSRGNEIQENDYIKIGLGEEYNLNIKVFPELATNKTVLISNSDKNVCSIDEETHIVTGLSLGGSKLIITSQDRKFVQFIINISVTQDDIQDIDIDSRFYDSATNSYIVEVAKGKSEVVDVTIVPRTTLQENRELVWESSDDSIATVNNGIIRGINFGTTTITVHSKHKPEISKTITVTVTMIATKAVQFINDKPDELYQITSAEFDLKTITSINNTDITFDDIRYVLTAPVDESEVDVSNLSTGIIKFKSTDVLMFVSIQVEGYDYEFDSIDIWFVGEPA